MDMTKTMINIKTDKEIKENAQQAARDIGISISDVVNAALRNFIRTREVVFSDVPYMTAELERLLGPVEADIKNKKNLSPRLRTKGEVAQYLDTL